MLTLKRFTKDATACVSIVIRPYASTRLSLTILFQYQRVENTKRKISACLAVHVTGQREPLCQRRRIIRWFKHLSDSHDDPFIQELIEKHGHIGYYVFFAILEIYAREYKPDMTFVLDTSWAYMRAKLGLSHWQQGRQLEAVLASIATKWDININHDRITIYIPKFNELLTEATIRRLREKKGQQPSANRDETVSQPFPTPKKVATDVDVEEEKEKDFDVTRTIARESTTMKIETGSEPLKAIIKRIIPEHPWEETKDLD